LSPQWLTLTAGKRSITARNLITITPQPPCIRPTRPPFTSNTLLLIYCCSFRLDNGNSTSHLIPLERHFFLRATATLCDTPVSPPSKHFSLLRSYQHILLALRYSQKSTFSLFFSALENKILGETAQAHGRIPQNLDFTSGTGKGFQDFFLLRTIDFFFSSSFCAQHGGFCVLFSLARVISLYH
jgi:hypothetical protein